MRDWSEIARIPTVPGIYCLMSASQRPYNAYVGVAGNLRGRIHQHLSYRDSSVVTGVSATSLNPDLIGAARWWSSTDMDDAIVREAAELVAFEILNPALRSRGAVRLAASELSRDAQFRDRITELLHDEANEAVFPSVEDLAKTIRDLQARVIALEHKVGGDIRPDTP